MYMCIHSFWGKKYFSNVFVICIDAMSYITTSKTRGKGLAIWIFLLCAFFLSVSIGGKGHVRIFVTIRLPLSTWRQEGSDYGFQHYGSQSQMYLDRSVIYTLCEQIGPPKTFLHFILQALLQKPNPTWCAVSPTKNLWECNSELCHSDVWLGMGFLWSGISEGIKRDNGPFVQFWWTSFTYGIMRLCSQFFFLCYVLNHRTCSKGREKRHHFRLTLD